METEIEIKLYAHIREDESNVGQNADDREMSTE